MGEEVGEICGRVCPHTRSGVLDDETQDKNRTSEPSNPSYFSSFNTSALDVTGHRSFRIDTLSHARLYVPLAPLFPPDPCSGEKGSPHVGSAIENGRMLRANLVGSGEVIKAKKYGKTWCVH